MCSYALALALAMLLGAANTAAQAPAGNGSGSKPRATAQTDRGFTPRVEIAGGYSYLRPQTTATNGFNMNGGSASVAAAVNSWLSFVGDVGYYSTNSVPPAGFTLNITTYMAGPRLSYRRSGRVTPFAQQLVGVGHAGGTLYTAGFQQGTAAPSAVNAFAMASGAGLDVNLGRRFAIRAIEADWLFTTFPNGSSNHQNSVRLTVGVVWRIGVH